MTMSQAAREEVALMILLWKDFKSDGKFDIQVTMDALVFADLFGVRAEFDKLMPRLPPMKITPR